MQVLIDLRPQRMVHAQEQTISPLRLALMVFFGAFVAISVINVVYASVSLRAAKSELDMLRDDSLSLENQSGILGAQIDQFKNFAVGVRHAVEFSRNELPTVEFLAALEGITPNGLKIETLSMNNGAVNMRGGAMTDDDVVQFGEGLNNLKGMVVNVDTPVTTKRTAGNRIASDFSIGCTVKPLGAITNEAADTQPASSGASDDENVKGEAPLP